MANMEHVQLVRRGRDHVARWREANPTEPLDLNAAYMSYVRAPQVNISGADLRNSDLMGAVMRRANLSGCFLNPSHLYHADLREANLSAALFNGSNMRGVDLRGADLTGADLDRTILSDANLSGANLTNANLQRASLIGANLSGANLTGANFSGANIVRTNMSEAILNGADLFQTQIWGCDVSGTDFTSASLGYTVVQDCDLREAIGLDQARHDAPSSIGVDTVYRSGGLIPTIFLAGAGVPATLASFQEAIAAEPLQLSEYYISCRDDDEEFAQKLSDDLGALGVKAWVFSQHARGNALVSRLSSSDQEEIERWLRNYDKMIVVASSRALDTELILNDITAARDKQQSADRWLLFFVAPDNGLMRPGGRAARTLAAENVIFDLRPEDSATYEAEVAKLANALKQDQPASAGVPAVDFQL
ncbi:Uncharacterized protein in mobD 3'region [Geodia barretti]|uniref:Uncharacterized protein in mobD 3'region n=1 Tax=Geodia barretti TaxID=519541 RepID=A0AA35RDF3_GEOBA|nr:Uncharacterized protein in mobD 3'region [Geodia barretti]